MGEGRAVRATRLCADVSVTSDVGVGMRARASRSPDAVLARGRGLV